LATFCSFFQQILSLFPRGEFDHLVSRYQAERHARGFASWDHFVAMLYCQVGRAQSLGEICDGLNSLQGKKKHLGIDTPRKSTLAYANAHRPASLFEGVFHSLIDRVMKEMQPKHRFRFKNKLLTIDTTTIDLCASMFDWAHFMRTKGAVKLHMVLDHAGLLPLFCTITTGKASDIQLARTLNLPAGTILVCDRGYVDFFWFRSLTERKICFVTRLRSNDPVQVSKCREVKRGELVIYDETIQVGTARRGGAGPLTLRQVTVPDENGSPFRIVTNNFKLAPSTIAEIYRQRWQIETFFKAIKQNLRIKTFVGTSANALRTQVWSALIAIVILKYLQMKARVGWSLSRLVALFRLHLLSYRDLWSWLDDPFSSFESPPGCQIPLQFGQHAHE
jgi:DDE family transposase/uncharacterized protein DUF4372